MGRLPALRYRRGSWLYIRTSIRRKSTRRKRAKTLKAARASAPPNIPIDGASASDVDTEDDLDELSRALDLDKHGRLRGVSGLTYESISFSHFLSPAAAATLRADCLVLDRLETQRGEGSNTYWMPADATPRCGFERAAKEILDYHTRGCRFPLERSGAEWWTQIRKVGAAAPEGPTRREDVGTQREGPSIGFHWDMDLEVMRDHGLGLHPHLSTVTYLSDVGGPTAVASQRRPDEEAGVRLKPRALLLSFPSVGKHFAFDGRFVHGAPSAPPSAPAAPGSVGGEQLRVTFLVNIWLGYTPAGVRRFEASPAGGWSAPGSAKAAAERRKGKAPVGASSAVISPSLSLLPTETGAEGLLASSATRRRYPLLFIGDDVDVELSLPALPAALNEHAVHRGRTIAIAASRDGQLPVHFEEDLCTAELPE
jgi:hypothetical protein